ncbi:MAG: transposase [Chlorobiaceae bacterium]|nr:transposase [Chlorobiaceae bacterium]
MELNTDQYYHIYNRSINNELVFHSENNYDYFLRKYQHYFSNYFDTITYCLMPTHFHFLVFVKSDDIIKLKNSVGIFLSSYTKALNIEQCRHGNLFQQHTKSRHVDKDSYLISVASYIHQNPIRSGIVNKLEDWKYSSYLEYIGLRKNSFVKIDLLLNYFSSIEDFKTYSEVIIENKDEKYWI